MMFIDVDTDFQSTLPNFTGVAISSGPPDPEAGQLPLTVGIASLSQGGVIDPETGKPEQPSKLDPGIYGNVVIDPVLGQAVYVVPSEAQRPRFVSHMLLQDVVVLQVGNFPLPGEEAQPQGTVTPTPEPPEEEAVTVIRVGTGDGGEGLTPHHQNIQNFEDQNPEILAQLEAVAGRDYYARLLPCPELILSVSKITAGGAITFHLPSP